MESINELINKYHNKTIVFNDKILKTESDFSPKQKAKVLHIWNDDFGVLGIEFNFFEFEEENQKYAEHIYYDLEGKPRLSWKETRCYPENKKTTEYFEISDLQNGLLPFDIIDS